MYLLSTQCQELEEVTWPLFHSKLQSLLDIKKQSLTTCMNHQRIGSGGFCKKNQECSQGFTNCLKRHCLIPTYSAGLIKILQEIATSTISTGSSSTQLHSCDKQGIKGMATQFDSAKMTIRGSDHHYLPFYLWHAVTVLAATNFIGNKHTWDRAAFSRHLELSRCQVFYIARIFPGKSFRLDKHSLT